MRAPLIGAVPLVSGLGIVGVGGRRIQRGCALAECEMVRVARIVRAMRSRRI
jgi:hypothetical protein